MDNILDQCSIKELILFDLTKPMATTSTIITIAIGAVILNNIIYNIVLRNSSSEYVETLNEEQGSEFDVYKDRCI